MNKANSLYYDDLIIGRKIALGEHYADKSEVLDFARKWDPQPFHIDEEQARSYPYGGLIAPVMYTLALFTRLAARSDQPRIAVIGVLEFERVRIFKPVRPGDHLIFTTECIEKRESKTKRDRGIVRFLNEARTREGELVLSYITADMVLKESGEAASVQLPK